MADLPSARSPDPQAGQSTRQLLEELDDLMQRMLALPVQQGDEDPQPAPGLPAPLPHTPAQPPTAHRSTNQLHVPAMTVTVQATAGRQPAENVAAPAAPVARQGPATRKAPPERNIPPEPEPAPTYLPFGAEPLLPILLQNPVPAKEKRSAPALQRAKPIEAAPRSASPPPGPLAPARTPWQQTAPSSPPVPGPTARWLVAINRTFDRSTTWFGAVGRWLRSDPGRSVIGWSGLTMIAVAVIWALILFLS